MVSTWTSIFTFNISCWSFANLHSNCIRKTIQTVCAKSNQYISANADIHKTEFKLYGQCLKEQVELVVKMWYNYVLLLSTNASSSWIHLIWIDCCRLCFFHRLWVKSGLKVGLLRLLVVRSLVPLSSPCRNALCGVHSKEASNGYVSLLVESIPIQGSSIPSPIPTHFFFCCSMLCPNARFPMHVCPFRSVYALSWYHFIIDCC